MNISSSTYSNFSQLAGNTSIDLFSGGGGLALAMRRAGFQHLLTVERDERACSTLLSNAARLFSADDSAQASQDDHCPLVNGDVREVDFSPWLGAVDMVAGGVPCQPWSLGGMHMGDRDPRNLWPELLRCVCETRPLAVIAENVRGLLRPSFRPYYDYILRGLSAPVEKKADGEPWPDHDKRLQKTLKRTAVDSTERYDVTFRLVNAADYGVPQIRWRVFVVAFRADLGLGGWEFPRPTHSKITLRRSQDSGEYWNRHGIRPHTTTVSSLALDIDEFLPWVTLRDAISGMPEPVIGYEPIDWLHHRGWPGANEYRGHTASGLDRPSKTIKAGGHGVPGGEGIIRLDDGSIRNLTVRETARVMTFPDDWRLAGPRSEQMRQLGNAVPVTLGHVVADSVANALRDVRRQSG